MQMFNGWKFDKLLFSNRFPIKKFSHQICVNKQLTHHAVNFSANEVNDSNKAFISV